MKKIKCWIIVLVILIIGGWYVFSKDTEEVQSGVFTGTLNGVNYSFSHNPDLNIISTEDVLKIQKIREDRVIKPMDCGGFIAQSDELLIDVIFATHEPTVPYVEARYLEGELLLDEEGVIAKGSRDIPGMCGDVDELIVKKDGMYVIFNINSDTELTEEYIEIMKSFSLEEQVDILKI